MKNKTHIYIFISFFLILFSCTSVVKKTQLTNKKPQTKLVNSKNEINNINWKQLGPSVPNKDLLDKYTDATQKYWHGEGQVSAIWIDPKNDNHLLIAVAFGGLFETFDAGTNWKPISNKVPVNTIRKIKVVNNTIYISTGYRFKNPIRFSTVRKEFYGLGVIKSSDWGKTWHLPKVNFYCNDFAMNKPSKTIYAISLSEVFKSTDDGNTFKKVADFSKKDLTNINDKIELQNVVVHPTNANIVYVSGKRADSQNAKLFYKTIDGGKTWTNEMVTLERFHKGNRKNSVGRFIKDVALYFNEKTNKLWVHFSMAFQYENPRTKKIYIRKHLYIVNSTDFKKFKFVHTQNNNSGNHFAPRIYEKEGNIYLIDWYLKIKQKGSNNFVNVGVGKVHQDCRAVGVDAKGTIYYGNDAGIVKSINKGSTWTNAYEKLNANLIIEMGYYSNKTERRFAIGTQDAGYYLNNFDGLPRYPVATHEGGIYISPHQKDRIYVKDNTVKMSTNGGKKFLTLYLNNGKAMRTSHQDGMLLEDPVEPNILYVGHANDVYRSNDLGKKGTWEKISPKNGDYGRSIDLAIPKSDNKRLYLANRLVTFPVKKGSYTTYKTHGHLMKSSDKGKTWTKISSQFDELLSNAVISDVEVDDEQPDRVWFTVRNLNAHKKVYYSENAGKTWTNISYNLPNVPANRVEYNQKTKRLILANDYGVYYLENKIWKPYGKGLPKVIITSMFLDYNFNELIVSTFGRGVWSVPLKL